MASVRMSQMLRNEIVSSCLVDWDNANPITKYKEETARLFSKLARKITPYVQDSPQWKLAKKFAEFKEENYANFAKCMPYATAQAMPYKNSNQINMKDYINSLIEVNNLEGFDGCTAWVNNVEVNIIIEEEDNEPGSHETLNWYGSTADHQAIPFPINFAISKENDTRVGEVDNGYLIKTERNYNAPINGSLVFECSMSRKHFEKLQKLTQALNDSRDSRDIARREYNGMVNRLISACTSVKQLLDKWPGADKYLPHQVKEKLASKTTRSNNTAEREEVFANIDMHNLNKTAVKASL